MNNPFVEMITFQVKPDKLEAFETLMTTVKQQMEAQPGCVGIRLFKRFYTFDSDIHGEPPHPLSRIVKCVKYYAYWEFDTIENCGKGNGWLFDTYYKEIVKLLIMPFDINSGYSL